MGYRPLTINGHAINDGTNYLAFFTRGGIKTMPEAQVDVVDRPFFASVPTSKKQSPFQFPLLISMLRNTRSQLIELKGWLNTGDTSGFVPFVMQGDDGAQYSVDVTCVRQPSLIGDSVTFVLQAKEPFFTSTVQESTPWAVTASGQQVTVTPGGNLPAYPTIDFKPTAAKGAGFSYKRWVPFENRAPNPLVSYPYDITNGGLDTAALVAGGKMQADCDDLRVFIGGVEVDRWIADANTDHTKVWINMSCVKKLSVTVGVATGVGAITTLTFANTTANFTAFDAMPAAGSALIIESEIFTYTGKNRTARQFTGVTRACKGTAAANHVVGTAVRFLPVDMWMFYGNPAMDAPLTDDTKQPPFNLSSSTNTSHVYETFQSEDLARAAGWLPSTPISVGGSAFTYTAEHITDADPATEMGMRIGSYQVNGVQKAGNGQAVWSLYNPCGVTHATATGEKYRKLAGWAIYAVFQKSLNGKTWANVWSEVKPASADTWTAWAAHSAVSLVSTYYYLRFMFQGQPVATADNQIASEAEAVTLTLSATQTPTGSVSAEQSAYEFDGVLTNVTTGDYVTIKYTMELDQTLRYETDKGRVTYLKDNTPARSAIVKSSNRFEDFPLLAGQANLLQWDDAGTSGVTVTISYYERLTP